MVSTCPECNTKMVPGGRFCPRCGKPIFAPTATVEPSSQQQPSRPASDPPAPGITSDTPQAAKSSATTSDARTARAAPRAADAATIMVDRHGTGDLDETVFAPGSLLGGRYRIIARLGKGGMGEVYRADDLKLGQQVALKFLPSDLAREPRRLERFREEVRISRQVAHPSVCRVYDLNDVEIDAAGTGAGVLHFLSMEYIDGEDLSSLLRRIGRLPRDKAVQVARQVCAGLAAAHAAGVLHRDLKPANIMLDGRGQAKIMDFGIAGAIGGIAGSDVKSGTPAYMAPESLAGREVSPRSDIYSLGLVLYELFTGKQAFAGETVTTASSTRAATTLTRPSTIIDDMDPAVERVIMRCLDDEPMNRPGSALSVAAALPGGDPLLAALEAGETPSPELVAAAGPRGTIRPLWAAAMVAFSAACIAVVLWGASQTQVMNMIPADRAPAVLEDRAKEMLRTLGYTEAASDEAFFPLLRREYPNYIVKTRPDDQDRWSILATGRPSVLRHVYRASILGELSPLNVMGTVRVYDPPTSAAGMRQVIVDSKGFLVSLDVTPPNLRPRREPPGASGASRASATHPADPSTLREPDVQKQRDEAITASSKLFELAGLDIASFRRVGSMRRPPHAADVSLAWTGALPEDPTQRWRVEAAFTDGKPTYFRQFGRWDLMQEVSDEDGLSDLGLGMGTAREDAGSGVPPGPPPPSPRTPGVAHLVTKSPTEKNSPASLEPPVSGRDSIPERPVSTSDAPASPPVDTVSPPLSDSQPAPASTDSTPTKASSPSSLPTPPPDRKPGGLQTIMQVGILITVIAGILFAAYHARRNYRIGRGDVLGASRLAGALVVMRLLIWACTAHHSTSLATEWNRFIYGLAVSLVPALIAWMLYMAVEPIVRRRDPTLLVSWTRLLSGTWRDPLVGRHILLSCCVGTAIAASLIVYPMIETALRGEASTLPPPPPRFPSEMTLDGVPGTAAFLLTALVQSTINGLLVLFFYVGIAALVRVKAVAIALLFLFVTALITSDGGNSELPTPGMLAMLVAVAAGLTYYIVRFGLLATIAMHFVFGILANAPMTPNLGAWYATTAVASLLIIAGLLTLGYVSAAARAPAPGARSV